MGTIEIPWTSNSIEEQTLRRLASFPAVAPTTSEAFVVRLARNEGGWSPLMEWCAAWPHSIDESVPAAVALQHCRMAPSPPPKPLITAECKSHWRVSSVHYWAAECPWPPLDERREPCFGPSLRTVWARWSDWSTDPIDFGQHNVADHLGRDKRRRALKPSHGPSLNRRVRRGFCGNTFVNIWDKDQPLLRCRLWVRCAPLQSRADSFTC